MRRLVFALFCGAVLALPPEAVAFDNDLQLHKLGAPRNLENASGERIPADPFAQERFARFASEFALATALMPADLNASLGDAGFGIVFTPQMAFVHGRQVFSDGQERDVWPTETPSSASKILFLPTLHLRKGLPFSLELGTDVSYIALSTMVALNASVKWAFIEGFQWWPDVAVRAFVGTVLGTGALTVVTGGWDVGANYRFPMGGTAEGAFYGGYQSLAMNASTGNIDFDPTAESDRTPSGDDGVFETMPIGPVFSPVTRFNRVYFGAQVRFRVLVVGIDGVSSWGTNSIAQGAATTIDTSVFKLSGRLGITF